MSEEVLVYGKRLERIIEIERINFPTRTFFLIAKKVLQAVAVIFVGIVVASWGIFWGSSI